jgi:DNA polymerase-3 subunit gamma/tau
LKTLEEPPPHVKFIFATTEVHRVPVTILSRVQRFDFKMIPAQVVAARLRYVLGEEKIEADDAAISIVAREAAGSMRDAMSLLDQLIAWGGNQLRGEDVARVLGVASHAVLYELSRALVSGDAARCLEVVAQLSEMGQDIPHAARDLLSLLRDLVVAKVSADPARLLDLPDSEAEDVKRLAKEAGEDDLTRLYHGFSQGYDEVVKSGQPRAAFEMLLVRLARRPPLIPLDTLLQRLERLERRLTAPAAHNAAPPRAPHPAPPGSFQPRPRESRTESSARPEVADDRKEPPGERRADARDATPRSTPPQARDAAAQRTARSERPAQGQGSAPRQERSEPSSLDPEEVLRNVVARVAIERAELAAKLEHGVALEAAPGRLVLGWAKDNMFGALVATPENTALVERAATAVLGTPTRVVHEHDSARAEGKKTLSNLEAEARAQRLRETYERLKQHPRIADAVEILGARLKDLKLAKGN